MHALNKTLGIVIAGAATLALTAIISIPNQKPSYQIIDIKDVSFVNAAHSDTYLDASDDDQYEVHVRVSKSPFEVKSGGGYINHGFENALHYKRSRANK
ncbi:hypothetical protein F9L33_12470 [Amylibacter sp. SFDW26]|uniref:hypothetical protein n=1 Tax=Amylibacter sp. SFDW26 TaxID=2652722 RepID=UPI0012622F54|nr:hypothetical protein [Amylibacter sp. SFDW26]KAB7613406.1 hypothetical protein F9L33_12470 [Amylibacter sp. SFDW26]